MTETSRTDLVQEFVVLTRFFFGLLRLAFKRGRNVGIVRTDQHCLEGIFFGCLLGVSLFGCGDCGFEAFEGFSGFGSDEESDLFGDVHVECELEVDIFVFVVEFEVQVGGRGVFLLFLLYFFQHVLF